MREFKEPIFNVGDRVTVIDTYQRGEVVFISITGGEPIYVLRMYNNATNTRYLKQYQEHEITLGW